MKETMTVTTTTVTMILNNDVNQGKKGKQSIISICKLTIKKGKYKQKIR